MDKTGRAVCLRHIEGYCPLTNFCPLRHLVGDKAVVCKHWLRGLCKKVGYEHLLKLTLSSNSLLLNHHNITIYGNFLLHDMRSPFFQGDACEFLHEYDLTKMPECFFFSKYQACSNRECPFRYFILYYSAFYNT